MTSSTRILVAGASGRLGSSLVPFLHQNGFDVSALSRKEKRVATLQPFIKQIFQADLKSPANLPEACKDQDIVFSCAGASLDVQRFGDRSSFYEIDFHGNALLLEAALAAGVKKFVYVSVFGAPTQRNLAYSDAHERFVDHLADSGISYSVIRPTGFFGIFEQFFSMAQMGLALMIGDGNKQTNPIHEADLAEVCLEAIRGEQNYWDVGGPEILTRRQTLTLAFEALNKKPRILGVPPVLFKTAAAMISPIQARVSDLLSFGTTVSINDTIAPAFGKRRLKAFYKELADQ